MEEYYNELWANQLSFVEKGQEQIQDMTKLIMQGINSFEKAPEMLGDFSSSNFWSQETYDYIKAWDMTSEDFVKFFNDYLNLIGLVPKKEHLELLNKYNDLNQSDTAREKEASKHKKLVADKNQEIARLNRIVADQKKEISKQKRLAVDQKKRVDDLKKEVSDQKKLAVVKNKEIANQKKHVGDLTKEVADQLKSIKQLQSQTSA